ncbi:retrovirus-related pol polyprotein from transposon TNT 1-94 [Tanacetum coccineum]
MLAMDRYAQWRSRFLRYIDTKTNDDALRKCILEGPYIPSTIVIQAVPATENSSAVPKPHRNKTNEIYSTVDACNTTHEMWEAIERLQQLKDASPMSSSSTTSTGMCRKEVNELRAERIAKNANPLALVATAQPYQDPYYQTSKSHKSSAPTSKASLPTRSHATIRHKGKDIAKLIIPPSESASEEDMDTTPRYKNDNQSGQFRNQRTMTVAGARETVEKGVQLQEEKSDWLADTDEEIDKQELEAHYNYIAKIQEVHNADSCTDSEPLEQNDQNAVECDDERAVLDNLIANLKLDIDENKKIQKKLKKANASLTQELKECKSTLEETSRTLGESNSIRDSCLVALQNKQTEFERYKAFNDRTIDYDKLERVIHKTNVSRPQLRSTQMKDKVVPRNIHVKDKKTEVEDHHRISSTSNKTKSKPKVVPISTRKPKSQANKSVATPHKKTVASESTTQKSKSYYRMLYEKTSKAWKWWIEQQCPSGYKWVPKTKMKWVPKVRNENVQKRVSFAIDNASRITNIVQLILFIVDSGCTKHMTGNLTLLCNFVEKYLGTVHFGNDQFAPILGYGDLVQGNITINRKSTCFIRDLQGNDLLTGNRGSDLYTISLQETTSSTPICLMAKASPTQAWLWHRRLSHLNFDYINLLSKKDVVIGLPKLKYVKDQLCSSLKGSKAKRSSFKTKAVPSSKGRLNLLHMDLCGPMRVASINGKKYILVSDYDNFDPDPQLQNVSPSADTTVPSHQELDLLFGPLYDEFFNAGTSRVNKSSSTIDNSTQQDTLPSTNIHPTTEPSTPTHVNAEENNNETSINLPTFLNICREKLC